MVILIAVNLFLFYITFKILLKVEGKTNWFFSKIWSEKEINKDTRKRLKELSVDSDVPEETALLIASKEQKLKEEELIRAFNALDAKDLAKMIKGNKRDMLSNLITAMDKSRFKNTRR